VTKERISKVKLNCW